MLAKRRRRFEHARHLLHVSQTAAHRPLVPALEVNDAVFATSAGPPLLQRSNIVVFCTLQRIATLPKP